MFLFLEETSTQEEPRQNMKPIQLFRREKITGYMSFSRTKRFSYIQRLFSGFVSISRSKKWGYCESYSRSRIHRRSKTKYETTTDIPV